MDGKGACMLERKGIEDGFVIVMVSCIRQKTNKSCLSKSERGGFCSHMTVDGVLHTPKDKQTNKSRLSKFIASFFPRVIRRKGQLKSLPHNRQVVPLLSSESSWGRG